MQSILLSNSGITNLLLSLQHATVELSQSLQQCSFPPVPSLPALSDAQPLAPFDIPAELPEGIKEEAGLGPDINPDFFSCLRKKLSRTGEKREKHGEYHFICDIDKNSFPLCRIQVFFDENITAEIENDIDMFYWTFVSEYNFSQSRGICRHFIIDSSDITKSSENSLIIKADFGNCGRRVLHEFLQKLDDFYFNIEKVSVY